MQFLGLIGILARAFFVHRTNLAIENLALRQQLAILIRKTVRPRLRDNDSIYGSEFQRTVCWIFRRSAPLVAHLGRMPMLKELSGRSGGSAWTA